MHVIFDGRYIQDRFPGIGRYAFHLLSHLSRSEAAAFSVLLQPQARNTRHPLQALDGRLRRHPVGLAPLSMAEQLRLPEVIEASQAGLLHSPHFVFPYLVRTPTVITLFDLIPLRFPDELPGKLSRLAYRLHLSFALRRARAVITASRASEARLLRLRPQLRGRVSVVPLGVSARFSPQAGPPPKSLEPGYLLYVGTNKPHKNVRRLVEAFLEARLKVPLVLAGHPDPRYPWSSAIPARARERVIALGDVEEAELPGLYRHAAGLATLSLDEGFGLPVLEAMACGTPVMASARGALPEVVGEAGILVDPEDFAACVEELRRLAASPSPDDRARQRAAAFSWQRCAEQTLEAYRSVLAA